VGRALDYLGRNDEAAHLYQQALQIYQAVYGEEHLRVAQVLSSQGALSLKMHQFHLAEEQFARAAAIFKKAVGDKHEFYAHQLSNLGAVYVAKGQYIRAEQFLQSALDRLVPALPDHRYTGMAHIRMANALAGQKRFREAEPHALAGFRTFDRIPGTSPVELQSAREALALIYTALHEPEKMAPYRIGAVRR
jgi:serine/threonine-protein kinase